MKILHIGSAGIIMIPFVEFINKNFSKQDHLFILNSEKGQAIQVDSNVLNLARLPWFLGSLTKIWKIYKSEQIILHGLFDFKIIIMLAFQPWLLKKINWAIWGGDLYEHRCEKKNLKWKIKEIFKKRIVPKIGGLITYIPGDYELAKQWYGAKGKWHECIMYPSNLYKSLSMTKEKKDDTVYILIGNSASPTNNHFDAFEKIRQFSEQDIKIFCPLSYGDEKYGDAVASEGGEIFGDKFVPIRQLMSFPDYIKFLAEIDVAVFNHSRQQAMGNIISLLGMGKLVFMRSDVTSYQALKQIGVEVGDISVISLDKLNCINNIKRVSEYFSSAQLALQWQMIFIK